jgi:hypothetical protein
MNQRYDAIYAQFNLDTRSINLAKNVLRVDPYSQVGCITILLYAFLVDSYHIPELSSSVIVGACAKAISDIKRGLDVTPAVLILIDKAFAIIPSEPVTGINMVDMSEITEEQLAKIAAAPITSDVINISEIYNRIIFPVLSEPEEPAAEAAQ